MKCWGGQELLLPDSFHQSLEGLKLFLVLLQLHLHLHIITLEGSVSSFIFAMSFFKQDTWSSNMSPSVMLDVSTLDGVVGGSVMETARVGARLTSCDLDVGIQGR